MPDMIYIYQKNIEALCRTEEEIREQVRKTVIHEIAHYFGLSDEEIRELERG
jgi:predicted Zn-dependent protease with MMP-like domain